jgi:hypothetical protein
MSSRTAIACPEPPRRPNEVTWWVSGTTTTAANATAWVRIDVKR